MCIIDLSRVLSLLVQGELWYVGFFLHQNVNTVSLSAMKM